MQLQIWSDYACPYCYIGKRHLEAALAEFPHADDVEIAYQAFELDRNASREVVNTTQQRIERKYAKSPQGALNMIHQIMTMARHAGLDMRYDTVRYTNTFDAHRLSLFAERRDLAKEVTEGLFHAYFTENRALADHDVLLDVATQAGLDRAETQQMLDSDAFSEDARAAEQEAERRGIHGVPCFVFDDGTTFYGAQPKSALLEALHANWEKQKSVPASPNDAAVCGSHGCSVP
ncbi:DsbA family oxidoreductase [Pseudomonas sp. RW10S2]|uniref:DsbA family oxidoreductase n=1 Tax=Pseudomonas sp. RW10S2 TaxID=459637 RepID=UPI00164735E5|nr:DsbA family oxidoreductase [Pseudomonas sp. RW10S2]MBC3468622.1 DsbA family oxidoreductase [Pseudomonas sp. RW10S2]